MAHSFVFFSYPPRFALYPANNNVNGDIPNEISTLFTAERLGLFGNGLTSTIPTGISNLTSVIILDFENNFMDGLVIPESVRQLATLEGLFFSRNIFTGSIPQDINRLSALSQFWVANNDIEGTIPTTLGDIPNLQTIIANTNRLRGNIPTQLGALNLTNVQLYENRLDGPIPGEIFQATNLNVLRLDFNFLDGTIDPAVGDLVLLEDLRLNNNILMGGIPSTISQLTNLQFLTAGSNFLDGPIPNVFALYQQLDTADFSRSSFSGTIPSSIFSVPTLRLLYLNNNALTGPIPASYANPPLLRDLFLNNNLLTGMVPAIQTGQLLALNELPLQVNRLTGSMPQSICLLRTEGELDDLFSDCGGATPEIECDFPACCNRCFESPGRRRLEQGERYNFDIPLW
jgi:Leucine-rich repeat (LRR) protein